MNKFAEDSIKGTFKWLSSLGEKLILIAIVLFALNYVIDNKLNFSFLKSVAASESARLKTEDGEVAKANIYMDRQIVVIQKAGEDPKMYVGVKQATLTKFSDDDIEVDIKDKGFGLEPGFSLGASDGLQLGLDLEVVYWRRWGAIVGISLPAVRRRLDRARGYAGLSYDIPVKGFTNVSVFGAMDTNRTPFIGLRTRFGGSFLGGF